MTAIVLYAILFFIDIYRIYLSTSRFSSTHLPFCHFIKSLATPFSYTSSAPKGGIKTKTKKHINKINSRKTKKQGY